jgi:hypothetical protein
MFKVVKWLIYFIITEFLLVLFLLAFNYYKGGEINSTGDYINNNKIYLSLLLGLIFIPILYINYKKLNINNNKIKDIHILILLGISLSLVYNVFGFYFDKLLNTNLYGIFDIKYTLISTVLIGPVIEEYLFRGLMYYEATKKYGKKGRIIINILFALLHTTLIQIIYAFIIGHVLIKVLDKYKNINSCIIVHLFSNLTTTFLTLLLIKNNVILSSVIFIIGSTILLFIKNKKYDII